MSKKKGMTPAQKAAARWEPGEAAEEEAPASDKGSAALSGNASPGKAAISLEGVLGPIALIAIIAVVGFILMVNQGGFA